MHVLCKGAGELGVVIGWVGCLLASVCATGWGRREGALFDSGRLGILKMGLDEVIDVVLFLVDES